MVTFRGSFGNLSMAACKFAAHVESTVAMNSSAAVCRAPPFFGSVKVEAVMGYLLENLWLTSFDALYTSIVRVVKVFPSILFRSGSTAVFVTISGNSS